MFRDDGDTGNFEVSISASKDLSNAKQIYSKQATKNFPLPDRDQDGYKVI